MAARFEYQMVARYNAGDLLQALNDYAADGWRTIGYQVVAAGRYTALMEREVPADA